MEDAASEPFGRHDRPNTRRSRITDVAAIAGVSIGTVSNVFNHPERVSVDLRRRVLAVIHELDYVPNEAARELRLKTCEEEKEE